MPYKFTRIIRKRFFQAFILFILGGCLVECHPTLNTKASESSMDVAFHGPYHPGDSFESVNGGGVIPASDDEVLEREKREARRSSHARREVREHERGQRDRSRPHHQGGDD